MAKAQAAPEALVEAEEEKEVAIKAIEDKYKNRGKRVKKKNSKYN